MILISRFEAIANGTTPDAMLIPAIELPRGVLRSPTHTQSYIDTHAHQATADKVDFKRCGHSGEAGGLVRCGSWVSALMGRSGQVQVHVVRSKGETSAATAA
jgi:hypothetical protein